MDVGTTIQNLWDNGIAVLRGKFIALQAYLKEKQQKAQQKAQTSQWKKTEKEQQTKPKVSGRKEIVKNRAEINEIES